MEAAGPPLMARHVHEELNDIPILDKAFFVMMGNNYLVLGLRNKGHLGPGADADIALYPKSSDPKEMLTHPRYVIKDGLGPSYLPLRQPPPS